MFRWKGNTGDCFLFFPHYRVIFPLNTSIGGLFSYFTLSSFCAFSKFFLYVFGKVLFFLACITGSSSSGQLPICLLSANEQNEITTYCTPPDEPLPYAGRCSSCTGIVVVLHRLFFLSNLIYMHVPASSTPVWSQSSAFWFVLDNECSQWIATAFCCG